MEVVLHINGEKIRAEIDEADIARFKETVHKTNRKTGYEFAEKDFFFVNSCGEAHCDYGEFGEYNTGSYKCGNMYTDEKVAEHNARADNLKRNLRRFAAEHGGCGSIGAFKRGQYMWCIVYCSENEKPIYAAERLTDCAEFGNIYFCSKEATENAIKEFYDELMWYFTEYDPMPEGWWDD